VEPGEHPLVPTVKDISQTLDAAAEAFAAVARNGLVTGGVGTDLLPHSPLLP